MRFLATPSLRKHGHRWWALFNNTTGNTNIAIGYLALSRNITGGGNTAVGR